MNENVKTNETNEHEHNNHTNDKKRYTNYLSQHVSRSDEYTL